MFNGAYLKQRLGWYGALWVGGFLLSGVSILLGMLFADMMAMADIVLPVMMGAVGLALGVAVVMALVSGQTLGTKLVIVILALLLVLPLFWAPVSAAVVIAFFADRSIEYSAVYAGFQIGVSRLLYPLTEAVLGPGLFDSIWGAFQVAASIVGFFSALSNLWPRIRRLLGPEPVAETVD